MGMYHIISNLQYVPYNFKFACSWCAKLYHQLSGKSFEQSDETGYLVL